MYVAPPRDARSAPAPGSCTRAASTRSRTTSASSSPCSSCRATVPITRARRRPRQRRRSPVARSHSALTALRAGRQSARPSAGAPAGRAAPRGAAVARGRRASRTGTRCSATGCCRCRPSTRSSSPAAAPPWRRTARTSATRTTPATKTLPLRGRRCRRRGRDRRWPRRWRRCGGSLQSRVRRATGRRGASGEVLVLRRLRRRGRRPHGVHRGRGRRPGLRRDREDARRVRAVPGLRRQPGDRRSGDHRARRWGTRCSPGCRRRGSGSRSVTRGGRRARCPETSHWCPRSGVEPTTFRLGGGCSIH